jgi:hypothetical protein
MSPCPGLFHGDIPIPLAVECDAVHVLLGVICGVLRPLHTVGPLVFVLYQAVEELPAGALVHGFVKDVVYFLLGYLVARACVAASAGQTDGCEC